MRVMSEIAANTSAGGRSMTVVADPWTAASSLIPKVYRSRRRCLRPSPGGLVVDWSGTGGFDRRPDGQWFPVDAITRLEYGRSAVEQR
jgi:hypothetical protein